MTSRHHIELSDSELVVLNAVLSQLSERPDFEIIVPDPADQRAVHNLVSVLERRDPTVFASDYEERLTAARRDVLSSDR